MQKEFDNIKVYDFTNENDQEFIISSAGVIFTSSLDNFDMEKLQLEDGADDKFDEIIGFILNDKFEDKYTIDDIVISITPKEDLEELFGENYKDGYSYFLIQEDNFFMIFD